MNGGGASDYYEASTIDIASDIDKESYPIHCSIVGTFGYPVKLGIWLIVKIETYAFQQLIIYR